MRITTTMTTRRTLTLTAALLLAGLGACAELEQEGRAKKNLEGVLLESVEQNSYLGDLGTAMGRPVAVGNTNGLTNEHTASCLPASASNTAPEATFTWKAPAAGTYVITTRNSSFDTTLDVYNLSGASIACNDNFSGLLQSKVVVTLAANQEILIHLDGKGTASGAYRLNIKLP